MKIYTFILPAAMLCSGCDSKKDAKPDAAGQIENLAQKLDMVISNQSVITAQLRAFPKIASDIGFFYHTNETHQVYLMQSNLLTALNYHEISINNESRRIGTIIFTNVASFQSDILNVVGSMQK